MKVNARVSAKATIRRAIAARGRQGSRDRKERLPPVAASRVPRGIVRRARVARAVESKAVAIATAAAGVAADVADPAVARADRTRAEAAQTRAAARTAVVAVPATAADRAVAAGIPAAPAAALLEGSSPFPALADS